MRKAVRIGVLALSTLALAGAAFAARFGGSLRREGDARAHWVRLTRGDHYHFKLHSWPGSARFDMELFDENGRLMKDRPAHGDSPEMDFRAPYGGWYRLRVVSARGGGDYDLRVDED